MSLYPALDNLLSWSDTVYTIFEAFCRLTQLLFQPLAVAIGEDTPIGGFLVGVLRIFGLDIYQTSFFGLFMGIGLIGILAFHLWKFYKQAVL